MSECIRNCKLCPKLILSTAITFDGTSLVVNLPANSYGDCQKYCVVFAQAIPDATTITSPVFIQIGAGTELYALNKCDCTQATACSIRTRTKYATRVETSATTGVFKLLGNIACAPNNNLTAIDGTAVTGA